MEGKSGTWEWRACVDVCPVCGSHDICGAAVEIEGENAVQECSCASCDSDWYDVFSFSSTHITKDGTAG